MIVDGMSRRASLRELVSPRGCRPPAPGRPARGRWRAARRSARRGSPRPGSPPTPSASRRPRTPDRARPCPARCRRRPSPRSAPGPGRWRRSRRSRSRCARRGRPGRPPLRSPRRSRRRGRRSVIDERSASFDSRPGSVSAVTSWPSARSSDGDLVPRPRAEPEARDQDDRCSRQFAHLASAGDNRMHPWSIVTGSDPVRYAGSRLLRSGRAAWRRTTPRARSAQRSGRSTDRRPRSAGSVAWWPWCPCPGAVASSDGRNGGGTRTCDACSKS